MKKYAVLSAVIACSLLSGCKEFMLGEQDKPGTIYVSSIPLLQQVLVNELPSFGGQFNETVMPSVCLFVSGQIDQASLDANLAKENVDAALLQQIVGREPTGYSVKCAAYISAKIFRTDIFLASEHLNVKDEGASEKITERLQQLTPSAVHVAQYLAELAASSSGMTFSSVADYKAFAHQQVAKTASTFVKTVMNDKVRTETYLEHGENAGYRFRLSDNTIVMSLYDTEWLGNGKAMGVEYKVKIHSQ